MKKYVLIALMCLSSVSCFAELKDNWRKWEDVVSDLCAKKDENNEGDYKYLLRKINADAELALFEKKITPGIHLTSHSENERSSLDIRYLNGILDYRLHINTALHSEAQSLYIQFLDADRYIVKEYFVSKIAGDYEGTLSGSAIVPSQEFVKYKYYKLSIRGL